MPANPLSAQPAATSKPELTPTHPPFMSPGCVFPICFCVFQCRYCSSRGQGTDRLEAIFLDQFLLFVDFRATRHGHNCESGPHSSDRTVSICSVQTDDLLSTNQNVFGQILVFGISGLVNTDNRQSSQMSIVKVLLGIHKPSGLNGEGKAWTEAVYQTHLFHFHQNHIPVH